MLVCLVTLDEYSPQRNVLIFAEQANVSYPKAGSMIDDHNHILPQLISTTARTVIGLVTSRLWANSS